MILAPFKGTYSLPAYSSIVSVRLILNDQAHNPAELSPEEFASLGKNQPLSLAGLPIFYCFSKADRTLSLWPPPDRDYELIVRYFPAVEEI